jgi:hypothetical protein
VLRSGLFDDALDTTFYGQTRPIAGWFDPEALAVSGFSREQHLAFDEPKSVIEKFANWLEHTKAGQSLSSITWLSPKRFKELGLRV